MNKLYVDMSQKYGLWTPLKEVKNNKGWRKILCKCKCGNQAMIAPSDLVHNRSTMCKSCRTVKCNLKHGHSFTNHHSPEYRTWTAIKGRCTNPKFKDWHLYGGKGIRVCDRWISSFENFLADMGTKPSSKHSIDRIDSDGDYCPENCRWATPKEQARNTSRNRNITYQGRTQTLTEWARELGMQHGVLAQRLNRGMQVEKAFDAAVNYKIKLIEWNGEKRSIAEWSRLTGLKASLIRSRIERGWNAEKALTQKPSISGISRSSRPLLYQGKLYTVKDLAALHNMPKSTLLYRLDKGMSIEQAIKPRQQSR